MKAIGNRSKFYLFLFSILSITSFIGFLWYVVSICSGYSLILLILSCVFGCLFVLFFVIFLFEFIKRNDGVYKSGNYIVFKSKGKVVKLSLEEIKTIKYRNYNSGYFRFSSGDLYIDNYKISNIKNVKEVAHYLINERNLLNNSSL